MTTLPPLNEASIRKFAHGVCNLCGFTNFKKRAILVNHLMEDPQVKTKLKEVFEVVWEKYREKE